jgi:hypothetical protein
MYSIRCVTQRKNALQDKQMLWYEALDEKKALLNGY